MNRKRYRLLALLLAAVLLLTGCDPGESFQKYSATFGVTIPFSMMSYTRPDLQALEHTADKCAAAARNGEDPETVMEAVYGFYDLYDSFHTNYTLADLHCRLDVTDPYWEKEFAFCAENEPAVEAILEQMLCALADSPRRKALEQEDFFGEDFFDLYEDEPVMDEKLVSLMEQEAKLENQYYDLSEQYVAADCELSDALYRQMAELYIELIRVRQDMAYHLYYPNYPELAYDMYYSRDYTPADAVRYILRVEKTLYEPYVALENSDIWDQAHAASSEQDTFRYVKTAAEAMGGTVEDAFQVMEEQELYDIWYSKNKYNGSFETYIWNYYAPFVFVNPCLDHTDKLSFAHEFGHFAADYACDGSFAGTDIAEVQSQGMEYLSLCYGEDTQMLTRYQLASSLCVYMEQSAYSLFEHQVYGLSDEELTVQNLEALYEEIGKRFGFDSTQWDPRDYVTVLHLYTEPMYMISYVVSNDLALQFYQLEREQPGEGLRLYQRSLTSQDSYILAFAQDYGLQSPFTEDRMLQVKDLFQNMDI